MKDSKSDQRLRVIVPIIANVGLLSIFLLFLAVYFLNTRSSVEDVPETRQEAIALIKEANRAVGLLENHSLDQAVPLLEQIAESLPKNVFTRQNLAVAAVLAFFDEPTDSVRLDHAKQRIRELGQTNVEGRVENWLWAIISMLAQDSTKAKQMFLSIIQEQPEQAAGWYGLWRAQEMGEHQLLEKLETLDQAIQIAPSNIWLHIEWMRVIAKDPEYYADHIELPEQIESCWHAIAPYSKTIKTFTKIDLRVFLSESIQAAEEGQWSRVSARLFGIANVLTPQSELDRRRVSPHPLEFVCEPFGESMLKQYGLSESIDHAAIAVQFDFNEELSINDIGDSKTCLLEDMNLDGSLDLITVFDSKLVVWSQHNEGWQMLCESVLPEGTVGAIAVDLDLDFDEARRAVQSVFPSPREEEQQQSRSKNVSKTCPAADLDLVVFGASGITCLENIYHEGEGRVLQPFDFPVPEQDAVTSVCPVDLDADGFIDLVIGTQDELQVFTSLGSAGFRREAFKGSTRRLGSLQEIESVDFDHDVDIDLIVLGKNAVGWFENLRHGQFRFHSLSPVAGEAGSVEVIDVNMDFDWDVVVGGTTGLSCFLSQGSQETPMSARKMISINEEPVLDLGSFDYDNDGIIDLLIRHPDSVTTARGLSNGGFHFTNESANDLLSSVWPNESMKTFDVGDLDRDGDIDIMALGGAGIAMFRNQGGNTNHWIDIALEAQQVKGEGFAPSGRVNANGLGSRVEIRAGDLSQLHNVQRRVTHLGLGHRETADVVRVVWLNGVPQNIVSPPVDIVVCEQQVLLGSCPYLYVWNGSHNVFVTDLLWAAPIGLQYRENELMPFRSWEHLKISGSKLAPLNDAYVLQVTEELWEAAYFDSVKLTAVDHPHGVEIFSNEKVGPAAIAAFGIHTVRSPVWPVAAKDDRGHDILNELLQQDEKYPPNRERQRRQGLLELHAVELDLGSVVFEPKDSIKLFLTGWTFPTTVGINLALDRDPALGVPHPPSVSIPDGKGKWKTVIPFMGFPGGKTKTIVVDLTGFLKEEDPRVRIETSMDIRWDQAFFSVGKESDEFQLAELPLVSADLHYRGFSRVIRDGSDGPERFDYHTISTNEKWPPMLGNFTRYGDVRTLIETSDDQLVIMGAGDEMTLVFDTGTPCPPGWKRDFILSSVGWDKDANLATVEGQTTEPFPFRGMNQYPPLMDDNPHESEAIQRINDRFQTRRQSDGFWRTIQRQAVHGVQ